MIPINILTQSLRNWEPDWLSIAIGFVAGVALTVAVLRLLPIVRRWRQRAATNVRQRVANVRAGVETRYQTETAEYASSHHLAHPWASLEASYVPPRLLLPVSDYDPFHVDDSDSSHLFRLWPEMAYGIAAPVTATATVDQLLRNGRRVIISGAAGTGKSALLAYCTHTLATAALQEPASPEERPSPWLPVLLHLAEIDLTPPADDTPFMPSEPILAALQKRSNPITSSGLKDLLRQKLASDHVLLLLDGYDSAAPALRRATADWLRQLLSEYPNLRVFIAAAATGYGPLLPLQFVTTSLLPWRVGQVQTVAAQWAEATSQKALRPVQFWQPGQSALVAMMRLWRQTLLAAAKPSTGELPSARQYDLLTGLLPLFANNASKRNAVPQEPEPAVLAFWQRLAFALLENEQVALSRSEVEAIAAEVAAAEEVDESASKLQKSLTQTTLFKSWANGSLSIASSVWRDFLAAGHLAAQKQHETAVAHLRAPRWARVLRFYVAETGATELATTLLSEKDPSPTRDALFQVASWMPEASDGGDWRRQTLILLGQMIRQSSFAKVLRLRAVVALAQTGETGVMRFLSQMLERSDPFLRRAGVLGLSAQRPERALPLLEPRLADDDPNVRETAVKAIAWLHHPDAERPLITVLLGNDESLGQIAAIALAMNGGEGLNILKEAVKENNVGVRRVAIVGLSHRDDSWVLPLLADVERLDNEWIVQSAANMAQETVRQRQQPQPWQPLTASDQPWLREYARDEGRKVPAGAATMPFLVQILTESSWPNMRTAAARTLGEVPALEALPALETAVRDDDEEVREAAFGTLCRIRNAFL